jgi:hypothetical protein
MPHQQDTHLNVRKDVRKQGRDTTEEIERWKERE